VVVVESDNIEKNRQFVERIAAKMQEETNLFLDVFYAQNPMIMGSKGLLLRVGDEPGGDENHAPGRPAIRPAVHPNDELVSFF